MVTDRSAPQSINHRRGLLRLNVALLLILGVATILTSVDAGGQPGSGLPGTAPASVPPARSRGEYTMVSGRYQGGTSNAVWVLDAANGELIALSWDRANNELEVIGYRRLADDAQIRQGR